MTDYLRAVINLEPRFEELTAISVRHRFYVIFHYSKRNRVRSNSVNACRFSTMKMRDDDASVTYKCERIDLSDVK